MEIEHIVWETTHEDRVSGICEIEVIYHGGGSETFISQGVFIFDYENSRFRNSFLGEVSEKKTAGVSGIRLIRVGKIIK